MSEVGSKDAAHIIPPYKWIELMSAELSAGASYVIAEAREAGNVGIYRGSGEVREGLVQEILTQIPAEKILWEAPQKAQQLYFIELIGCNVNLGNIAPYRGDRHGSDAGRVARGYLPYVPGNKTGRSHSDRSMRRYGLIGYPLSHSFSQRYFTEKFEREGIRDCTYSNYSIGEIGELSGVLADPLLCGLNVTIPYKQQVITFLHELSPVVGEIGACNCIRVIDGRLIGYNTDVVGFEQSLVRHLAPHHRRALVLGTGGAAKAVEYVLRKLGIGYRMVSRRPRPDTGDLGYEQVDAGRIGGGDARSSIRRRWGCIRRWRNVRRCRMRR